MCSGCGTWGWVGSLSIRLNFRVGGSAELLISAVIIFRLPVLIRFCHFGVSTRNIHRDLQGEQDKTLNITSVVDLLCFVIYLNVEHQAIRVW